MNNFKKGDILRGSKILFPEAYHPIIFLGGNDDAPLAVILTTSGNFPCNIEMTAVHFKDGYYRNDKPSYFVAHRIQKMAEWGPYHKDGQLTVEGISFIESNLADLGSMTWSEYEILETEGCRHHGVHRNDIIWT